MGILVIACYIYKYTLHIRTIQFNTTNNRIFNITQVELFEYSVIGYKHGIAQHAIHTIYDIKQDVYPIVEKLEK